VTNTQNSPFDFDSQAFNLMLVSLNINQIQCWGN